MALKKVKGTLERVLDKNLQDLVRGIRNHKDTEAKYVAECIDEIKQELRQDNMSVKANAVCKLMFIQMIGYDISWAAFNVIEVMSSTKFTFKRMGYLAASQSFCDATDVLMLTTNMIRKDLGSQNMYDAGVALDGLSCFITPDLARDLANDIVTLMSSTKPYLRKKAVLIMYMVFLKYPEALRPAFPRLKEKLEDLDPGVQAAAVNVICELARKNPKNYLSLAPLFFKLMTSSTNNWVLIKIIKLFGALTPLEPRLGKKLIEPLTNLIHSTSAMSLLYECINTVIAVLISISSGIPNHSASIQLCVQKLRILIEDSDQNLKYLGLLAMSKILKTHPKSVQAHKDLVLQCLDDKDESIRLRALDLLCGMVSKKNLMEIVKKLMVHMDKAEGSHYRDELLAKIIEICSQSNYHYITNFEWYVSILVELTRMEGTRHGKLIASQMLDVAVRVQAIRHFAVAQMAVVLENAHALIDNAQRNGICEVLHAAVWICGEFSEHLSDPQNVLESMLRAKVTQLPGHIQSIYVHNTIKLYARILITAEAQDDLQTVTDTTELLLEKLPMFVQSADLEVQERACCLLQLIKYVNKAIEKGAKVADEVALLFVGELNPVAPKAQKKVPVPDGLDLDAWINEPPPEEDELEEVFAKTSIFHTMGSVRPTYENETKVREVSEEELEKMRQQREMEHMNNPNYLKGGTRSKGIHHEDQNNMSDVPISQIDLSVPLHVPGMSMSDKYLQLQRQQESERRRRKEKKSKKKKGKKKKGDSSSESEDGLSAAISVNTEYDIPEGANVSDDDDFKGSKDDPHRLLNINLDEPLRDEEILPVHTYSTLPSPMGIKATPEAVAAATPERKHRKEREKKHRKDKKERKHEKKSKKGHRHHSKDSPSLLIATADDADQPVTTDDLPVTSDTNHVAEKMDDMDFWLSGSTQDVQSPSSTAGELSPPAQATPTAPRTPEKHANDDEEEEPSRRKSKKEKRDKKEKRSKKKKKSEYIEADGITTPSKEVATPATYKMPPMSSYRLLAEDASLKMAYETRVSLEHSNQVVTSIIFSNLTASHLKDLNFNTLDSLNSKLLRSSGDDGVKVPFILLPNAENEGQFAFTVSSINMPQKLKGTLMYIVKNEEGATQEKIDFKLSLPCVSYLVGVPCDGDAFTKLLGSGNLEHKSSMQATVSETDLAPILAKICFLAHFSVVEQIGNTASLYSRSIQSHHLCLLVKLQPNTLNFDGKSNDESLLSNVLDDIRGILTT
ncbi:AP-3 complex subunit delta-1 [Lamellibrachia satsuma]|nr:AP-3 complex subunit delta-1 [Lamellibrachia satsuma]